MKHTILLLIFSITFLQSFSQDNEFYVKAGSGFYFFSGESVQNGNSSYYPVYYPGFNTFGNKPDLSLTGGGAFKRVTRSKLIFGSGAEFQYLSSRINIKMDGFTASMASSFFVMAPAEGTVVFNGQFISLAPFIGWRFPTGKNSIDITGGPEFAFAIKSVRKTDIESETPYPYEKKAEVNISNLDFRIQLQAEMNIRKINVYAGYAKGMTNYYAGMVGANPEAYSNFIRVGIGYRL